MKRFTIFLALLFIPTAILAKPPRVGFFTGKDLVNWMQKHEAASNTPSPMEYYAMGLYEGYIMGTFDWLVMNGFLCEPDKINSKQVIAIVSKYVKDNPKEWSNPASLTILGAFVDAFPCTKNEP